MKAFVMNLLSKIPDKIMNIVIWLFMIVFFSIFFHLFNNYDTSYDYLLHKWDYVKVKGVITESYSKGHRRSVRYYVDAEYEWNGKVCALRKVKRGFLDREGKEITLYVRESSGLAVRGITVNYLDIWYILLAAVLTYRWFLRSKKGIRKSEEFSD